VRLPRPDAHADVDVDTELARLDGAGRPQGSAHRDRLHERPRRGEGQGVWRRHARVRRGRRHGPRHRAGSAQAGAGEHRARAAPRRRLSVESDLYAPVKAFLEAQGYEVKAEVTGCDVVGTRGDEPPVIVDLKLPFTLALVLQGVDRLTMTARVSLAVPQPRGRGAGRAPIYRRDVRALCRRLGLGLMTVSSRVDVLLDP